MHKPLTIILVLIGIAFMAVAGYYFVTPAGSLAHWAPGYSLGSTHIHMKHGLVALILGLGSWVLAWFSLGSRTKSVDKEV